jgi:hypothetical protein
VGGKTIILLNEIYKSLLSNASLILVDGTFKSSPSEFCQVYVFQSYIGVKTYPLIYLLLPGKAQCVYELAFEKIKLLVDTRNLKWAVMDFELAAMNAMVKVFEVEILNCMFHYGQMMWRNLQKCGLSKQFLNDLNLRFSMKMLFSCVFLPPSRLFDDYSSVKANLFQTCEKKDVLEEFLKYHFKNTFEGSLFQLTIKKQVDCFKRIQLGLPLTTNSCEGWNRALNNIFERPTPSLVNFLIEVRSLEVINEDMIDQNICKFETVIYPNKNNKILDVIEKEKSFPGLWLLRTITRLYNFILN